MTTIRAAVALAIISFVASGQNEAEIRLSIRGDPKAFDPLLASDEASETVRYITSGVLIRLNRATQNLTPELAESWTVSPDGRVIDFVLRKGVQCSDGSPFDSADVAATIHRVNDRSTKSGSAETLRAAKGDIVINVLGPHRIRLSFPSAIAGLPNLFDQLAIQSSRSKQRDKTSCGPYVVSDWRPGQFVLLTRNTRYWKRDAAGRRLPYADRVRLHILASREVELVRFRRGELDAIDKVEPDLFERLRKEMPQSVIDAGPSLDSEAFWFNLASKSTVPGFKREWFGSRQFRTAVSMAVNRSDIVRVVYRGFARPAASYFSQSNRMWFNTRLQPHSFDPAQSLRILSSLGFQSKNGKLVDSKGNPVQFTLITNASSRSRVQIAAMLQSDLAKIGIDVTVVPLEFGSLVERIAQTRDYEACLLGFSNVEHEPNSQANFFLSSGNLHAWDPGQPSPATAWEAEIDRLVRAQAAGRQTTRKPAWDRIQEILRTEVPVIFLVHPNALIATSPRLKGVLPSPLPPRVYWNIEYLRTGDLASRN